MTPDEARRVPKVLLHDHLDGGLRVDTIRELADHIGHDLPADDPDELAAWFRAGADTGDILQYLATFAHTVPLLQTADALERVAAEAAADLAADGVVHAEVRFAPELHAGPGDDTGLGSLDEAIDSPARAVDALELGACRSVSCKAPRLGGIDRAIAVHDLCVDRGAGVWAGGMFESGVGRRTVLALAALPGMTDIGDVGPTSYLAADVVEQQAIDEGTVRVHDGPGIAPLPDAALIDELGEAHTELTR